MNSFSIVIPTYNRGAVLIDTIRLLLSQECCADELLIIDQTQYAANDPIAIKLQALNQAGDIFWVRLDQPSIPNAMNIGLKKATGDYVLFLDDDISFEADFICQHRGVLSDSQKHVAHIGQIIQPWQQVTNLGSYVAKDGLTRDFEFPFNSNQQTEIANCMAGNFCVNRGLALAIGGFDEQFEGVAYRFETEFCRRLIEHTGRLFLFVPCATLDHLKIVSGGTREHAKSHLTSLSSSHSVGDYYFALRQLSRPNLTISVVGYIAKRFFGSVVEKYYLKHPWWIPVRVLSETMGLVRAVYKVIQGPRFIY